MTRQSVYYVGTEQEVEHHALPLRKHLSIEIVPPESICEVASPGDLAIFFSEHFERFRESVVLLQHQQVATLYAIDGILEWRNAWENREHEPASPFTMRPVLSHKVATIGPSQSRVLAGWGNAGRIEMVGLPRLDRMKSRSPRESDDTFRMLVMSAKWPGFTAEQVENARCAFEDIKRFVERTPTLNDRRVEVVWRLTHGLDEQIGVANAVQGLDGRDLAQTLTEVDAVVTMPSTAMLEGMLQSVPVALLDYNVCPHYVPAAWEISAADRIAPVLNELASPSKAKLACQQQLLHDALVCDESATDRMVALIAGMLDEAARAQSENRPMCFDTPMLESPAGKRLALDHGAIFGEHESFAEHNVRVLQIALADARRYLDQRDQRIAQLEKELAQAHEIFEEVHRHPIAGPVVRWRQKMIDWMRRVRSGRDQATIEAPGPSKMEQSS